MEVDIMEIAQNLELLEDLKKQINTKISAIEKRSKTAREKNNKSKTKQIKKGNKYIDVLVDDIDLYTSFLSARDAVNGFIKCEKARRKKEEREEKNKIVAPVDEIRPVEETKKDDVVLEEQPVEEKQVEQTAVLEEKKEDPILIPTNSDEQTETKTEVQQTADQSKAKHVEIQRRAAVRDTAAVLERRRKDLRAAIKHQNLKNKQRLAATKDTKVAVKAMDDKADSLTKELQTKYQQGLIAGNELLAVIQAKVDKGELPKEKLIEAEETVRKQTIRNQQAVTAAKDLKGFTGTALEKLDKEERQLAITDSQFRVASQDMTKVLDKQIESLYDELGTINDKHKNVGTSYKPMTDEEIAASKEKIGIGSKPLSDSEIKSFKYKAMTDEEIEESRKKIASVPEADLTNRVSWKEVVEKSEKVTPTKTWLEMNNSIGNLMLKKERNDLNLSEEDFYALHYLRLHPEAEPRKGFIKELLEWARIAPYEKTTPRDEKPAEVQINNGEKVTDIDLVEDPEDNIKSVMDSVEAATDDKLDEALRIANKYTDKRENPMDGVTAATDDDLKDFEDIINKTNSASIPIITDEMIEEEEKAATTKKEPEKEKTESTKKAKKVTKIEKFKSAVNKKFLKLKGFVLAKFSKTYKYSDLYKSIALEIAELKANYKNIGNTKRNAALKELTDRVNNHSDGLSQEEKRDLYKRIVKLAKKIEKYNLKHANDDLLKSSDEEDMFEEYDEGIDSDIGDKVSELFSR